MSKRRRRRRWKGEEKNDERKTMMKGRERYIYTHTYYTFRKLDE